MTQTALFPAAPPAFVPAVISPCERYRYELRREVEPGAWQRGGPLVLFCGANPSTADAIDDDHTIRKELGFTRRWLFDGLPFDGFVKWNLIPWRSTDPKGVPNNWDAAGYPENEIALLEALSEPRVKLIVAAWGDCLIRNQMFGMARTTFRKATEGYDMRCFGLTKNGQPKHTLTLGYGTPLERWCPP